MKKNKNSSKGSFATLRKTFKYTKKRRAEIIAAAIFALISTAATLYIPILIGKAIDCIAETGNVDFTLMYSYFIKIAAFTLIAAAGQSKKYVRTPCTKYSIFPFRISTRTRTGT